MCIKFLLFYQTYILIINYNYQLQSKYQRENFPKLKFIQNQQNQKVGQMLPNYQREFMQKGLRMTLDLLQQTLKGQNKVIQIKDPEQLKAQIDFTIQQQPCGNQKLLQLTHKILDKQTKPYHPHFHNQLFGGFDQYSVLGAMIAPTINGSVYTYELAPCFTLMEYQVYKLFRDLLAWQHIDGIFTPGGSFANFMAITSSRYSVDPTTKAKGNGGRSMKIFTSQVSHYSMKKGAHFTGIGEENVVYVKCDDSGRMIAEQLQNCIQKQLQAHNICMLVNSTLGTTVQGNIDPILQISKICKKYKIWHHVDGALGGAILFSKNLMQNKQNLFVDVDSITIDPHKGLVVPLQLSLFLVNKKQFMSQSNSAKADYLFHKQRASYSGDLDIGDKSFQCGRVIDILKFWTYLKGNGLNNISKQVQNQHKLALYCKQYIYKHQSSFTLVIKDVQTFNVCFWYIPKNLKQVNFKDKQQYYGMLSQITVLAKKFMIDQGKMLVGYSKSQVKHYFWRTVMSNPYLRFDQIDYQMELIAKYCEQAYRQIQSKQRLKQQM